MNKSVNMKPKPKENFMPIWKFYVAINKRNAKCKFCGEMYSWLGRSHTQLRSHLEKKHTSQFIQFLQLEQAAHILWEAQKASSNTAAKMEGQQSFSTTTPTAVSQGQLDILASYMDENISFASGLMAKVKGTEFIKQWENLATILNMSKDGAYKSPDEWRDYWTKTKKEAEKKMKQNQKRNPAGTQWNSFETKIMNIMDKISLSFSTSLEEWCPVQSLQPALDALDAGPGPSKKPFLPVATPVRKEAPPTRVTGVPDRAKATFGMDEDRNPTLERIADAVERIVSYMETNGGTLLQMRDLLRK